MIQITFVILAVNSLFHRKIFEKQNDKSEKDSWSVAIYFSTSFVIFSQSRVIPVDHCM